MVLASAEQRERMRWASPAPLDECAETASNVSRLRNDAEVWWGGARPKGNDWRTAWCGVPVQITLDVRCPPP